MRPEGVRWKQEWAPLILVPGGHRTQMPLQESTAHITISSVDHKPSVFWAKHSQFLPIRSCALLTNDPFVLVHLEM